MEEQMSNRKKLKDLTIRDNFMFAAVMMQGDNCKCFLEMLLGIEIERIEISYEKSIIYNPECKGVRLDVFAKDENSTCYDIEMQVETQHLGKRTRYYHSHMDMELLGSGSDYELLPGSYVIFICDFDPFGDEKYCYTFENRCLENLDLGLGDESRSIFLSTRGKNSKEIPEELEQFLAFVKKDTASNDTETTDSYVKQLQDTIRSIKESREMECRYQFAGDMLVREYKRGKSEGRLEGKLEGKLETKRNDILELLERLGMVSKLTYERIMSEDREDVLKTMLISAAKADSLEQFEKEISNL